MLTDFLSDFPKILRPNRPTRANRSLRSKYLENWFKNHSKKLLRDFQINFLKILSAEHDPKKIRSLKKITERFSIRFSIDFEAYQADPKKYLIEFL